MFTLLKCSFNRYKSNDKWFGVELGKIITDNFFKWLCLCDIGEVHLSTFHNAENEISEESFPHNYLICLWIHNFVVIFLGTFIYWKAFKFSIAFWPNGTISYFAYDYISKIGLCVCVFVYVHVPNKLVITLYQFVISIILAYYILYKWMPMKHLEKIYITVSQVLYFIKGNWKVIIWKLSSFTISYIQVSICA